MTHCCQAMELQIGLVCEMHVYPFDCPDRLVTYCPTSGAYGLILHDGGTSSVAISFCPWCGGSLSSAAGQPDET